MLEFRKEGGAKRKGEKKIHTNEGFLQQFLGNIRHYTSRAIYASFKQKPPQMSLPRITKRTWAKYVSIKNTELAGNTVVCQPLFVL